MRALRVSFPGTVPSFPGTVPEMYVKQGLSMGRFRLSILSRKTWGQSPGIYMCFPSDLLAEYREQRVASQARSTALPVRFMVGDREFTKCFLCQIHHLPPLFLHNACSVPRRTDLS
jgi:hypothetical protein